MDIEQSLSDNRKTVNKLMENFFPRVVTREWLQKLLGESPTDYSLEALKASLTVPLWNFLDRGGKRWRPLLAVLCCNAVGGDAGKYMDVMLVPEFLHNGSLIVDDIEDSSEMRRGAPCLHKIYGVDIALNAANTFYYLPLNLIKQSQLDDAMRLRLYEILQDDVLKLHLGQATDIYWHRTDTEVSEEQYLKMCANKTGGMARLSAKLGAILGGATQAQIDALGKFAETIGVAFQIQDDILNIEGELGKEHGDDITEGKKSLPVLRTFSVANKADSHRLKEILRMHTKDKKIIDEALAIIRKYDGIPYSNNKATELVQSSLKDVEENLEQNEAKSLLKQLASFMIQRSN